MRIATWNVNSLKARLHRVESWIVSNQPDVLCLQETKMSDEAFPASTFAALGYESAHHGQGRWNGVAVLSRAGLADVRAGFTVAPVDAPDDGRVLGAVCAGVQVYSVYVPNGRVVGSEHYDAKLAWLSRLRRELDGRCAGGAAVAVCGDVNVAPDDRDVWDVRRLEGMTHVTAEERAALSAVLGWGLRDVVREVAGDVPGPFSWWDYRGGAFHKGEGMRIDLALLSAPLADCVRAAYVDREERKKGADGEVPSDHAPVVVDVDW